MCVFVCVLDCKHDSLQGSDQISSPAWQGGRFFILKLLKTTGPIKVYHLLVMKCYSIFCPAFLQVNASKVF